MKVQTTCIVKNHPEILHSASPPARSSRAKHPVIYAAAGPLLYSVQALLADGPPQVNLRCIDLAQVYGQT